MNKDDMNKKEQPMPLSSKIAVAIAAGSLLIGTAPALAGSAMTDAFVANVRPNVNFLDASSRLALDQGGSARVRSFAHNEAKEQTMTANSLVAWEQTNTSAGQVAALGVPTSSPDDPIGTLAGLPIATANTITSGVTNGVDGVLSGRSVAVDGSIAAPNPIPVPPGSALLPAQQDDLHRLQALHGRGFDALYKATQQDSLRQLATLYRDYIVNGDDPGLRAIAVRELPKINRRLAELRAL